MGGSFPGAGSALQMGSVGAQSGATPTGSTAVMGADGKPMMYDSASMAGTTSPTPAASTPAFHAAGTNAMGVPDYVSNFLAQGPNAGATAPTAGLIKGTRTSLNKPIAPPKVQTSSTPVTSGVTPAAAAAAAPGALPAVHQWGGATLGHPGTRQGPVDPKALAGITDAMWSAFVQDPQNNSEGLIKRLNPGYSNVHYGEKLMIPELLDYAVAKLGPGKVQQANASKPVPPMYLGDPSSSLYPAGYGR